jgi:hypothetical protein
MKPGTLVVLTKRDETLPPLGAGGKVLAVSTNGPEILVLFNHHKHPEDGGAFETTRDRLMIVGFDDSNWESAAKNLRRIALGNKLRDGGIMTGGHY